MALTKTPEQMAKEYGDYFAPGEDNKAYTSVIKEIAFLAGYQAAQQWISVKERLPEPENGSGIPMLVLVSGNGWHSHDVATFGPTVWRDIYGDSMEDVTHWMPLPKPPEEK